MISDRCHRSPRPWDGLGSHGHVADSAISIGVVLLALKMITERSPANVERR